LSKEGQIIVCEGCGSRWRVEVAKGRASVIARLVECPLCDETLEFEEAKEVSGVER
jgi:hypothetical protein